MPVMISKASPHYPTHSYYSVIHSVLIPHILTFSHSLHPRPTHSHIHSFTPSSSHTFSHSVVHSVFFHTFSYSLIHSVLFPHILPFSHSLSSSHTFSYSVIHSSSHSFSHSVIHSVLVPHILPFTHSLRPHPTHFHHSLSFCCCSVRCAVHHVVLQCLL